MNERTSENERKRWEWKKRQKLDVRYQPYRKICMYYSRNLSLSLLDFYHIVAMYYDALRNDEMQVSISFLRVNKFMRNFISYFENQIKSNKFAQSFTYWKEEKNGNE